MRVIGYRRVGLLICSTLPSSYSGHQIAKPLSLEGFLLNSLSISQESGSTETINQRQKLCTVLITHLSMVIACQLPKNWLNIE